MPSHHPPSNSGEIHADRSNGLAREDTGQCYVYLVLPDATRFKTAGRFDIQPDRDGRPQGQFVYCRSYIDNPEAVPIDPFCLDRLTDTLYRTTGFNGIFSSLRDAAPQLWARKVCKHTSRLKFRNEIDFLLHTPDDRVGALGFGHCYEPPSPKRKFYGIPDLDRLSALAEGMTVKDESLVESNSQRIRSMSLFRTSVGGSRPKAVVEDAEGLWLAKFNHRGDLFNVARVEHAMLELAKICGIRAAHSRIETVGDRDVLLVKRFDREKTDRGYLRYRTISGYTALRTDHSPYRRKDRQGWCYASLAEVLRPILAQPTEDSKELLRRMVFNAMTSKTDDGPSNHSIIASRAGWNLSPAYDPICWKAHFDPNRHLLAMNCGIHGRQANARNLLSECRRFCLEKEEATATIDAIEERVRTRWHSVAHNAGVSETDFQTISVRIPYPRFRHGP